MTGLRLNAAKIAELLAIAGSRRDATESERIEAVNSLLDEYRLQIAEYGKERTTIEPLLLQGIEDWGRRIFAEATPILTLARFLGKQKPGKRASPERAARDISVTLAVIDRMNRGITLEEASELVAADYTPRKVGKRFSLKADSVRKIYIRNETEQRARLAMNALEGLPPDAGRSAVVVSGWVSGPLPLPVSVVVSLPPGLASLVVLSAFYSGSTAIARADTGDVYSTRIYVP